MKTMILGLIERYKLWQVMRYGFVGLFVASCHAATTMLLHKHFHIDPTMSNFGGFILARFCPILALIISPLKARMGTSVPCPVSRLSGSIGITINVGLFKTLLDAFEVPFALNVFIAIALTPIAQYLMLHFWALRRGRNKNYNMHIIEELITERATKLRARPWLWKPCVLYYTGCWGIKAPLRWQIVLALLLVERHLKISHSAC